MIVRTEAIVLRSIQYGETSRIVTLFTREKGKIAVMARGALRPKSRFGSTLQPMSYVQVVLYWKASRHVQTLSESSHIRTFRGLHKHLAALAYGQRVVELVQAMMQDEDENPLVFQLLLDVLDRLDRHAARAEQVFYFFQLRLAQILGFAPHIDREEVERIPESGGVLLLENGSVEPSGSHWSRETMRSAPRRTLRAFAIVACADPDTIMQMRLDERTSAELGQLIEDFLRYHVEDALPTRGSRVVKQLLHQK